MITNFFKPIAQSSETPADSSHTEKDDVDLPRGTKRALSDGIKCEKCGEFIPTCKKLEHDDFHFAKSLADSERIQPARSHPILKKKSKKSTGGDEKRIKVTDFFKRV